MNCEWCGSLISPRLYQGGTAKKYCDKKCRKAAQAKRYHDRYPEKGLARQSRWLKTAAGKRADARKRAKADYPLKARARELVRKAVRSGRLQRSQTCEQCGGKGRIEGHHWAGYDCPLDVKWLCPRCHAS